MNGDFSWGFLWFNLDSGGQMQHANYIATKVAVKWY